MLNIDPPLAQFHQRIGAESSKSASTEEMHAPNFFDLLNLPHQFEMDDSLLERQYIRLQVQVHPDRYTNRPAAEQCLAAQWSTLANEAYRVLKTPLTRAIYMLKLYHIDPQLESGASLPTELLAQQMEWHERLAEATQRNDRIALQQLTQTLTDQKTTVLQTLATTLGEKRDFSAAVAALQKLSFIEQLYQKISTPVWNAI